VLDGHGEEQCRHTRRVPRRPGSCGGGPVRAGRRGAAQDTARLGQERRVAEPARRRGLGPEGGTHNHSRVADQVRRSNGTVDLTLPTTLIHLVVHVGIEFPAKLVANVVEFFIGLRKSGTFQHKIDYTQIARVLCLVRTREKVVESRLRRPMMLSEKESTVRCFLAICTGGLETRPVEGESSCRSLQRGTLNRSQTSWLHSAPLNFPLNCLDTPHEQTAAARGWPSSRWADVVVMINV
jgi:hypothetical protein